MAASVDARNWQPYHGAKNLPMPTAIEAVELMERFQTLATEETQEIVAGPSERAAAEDWRMGRMPRFLPLR